MSKAAQTDQTPKTEAYTVEVTFTYQHDSETARGRASAAADRIARVTARLGQALDPNVTIMVRGSTGDLLAGKAVYLPADPTPRPTRAERDRDRDGLGRDALGGGR